MTVKELITALNTFPSDAIVLHSYDNLIVNEVNYDSNTNTISFEGEVEFAWYSLPKDEREYEDNIDDDVDESNYNPYMGCDEFEYEPFDESW